MAGNTLNITEIITNMAPIINNHLYLNKYLLRCQSDFISGIPVEGALNCYFRSALKEQFFASMVQK